MRSSVNKSVPPHTGRLSHSLSILTAGVVTGSLEIILAISFGTLVFAGALPLAAAPGIGLTILGMALIGIVIAFLTSFPGIVGGSQSSPAVIIAVAVAGIVAGLPVGAPPRAAFITTVVAIALTTAFSGLFLWALGLFKLGSLGRFLPYPVVGGFLAGTGWLLVAGAIETMIALPSRTSPVSAVFHPDALLRWVPGLVLATAMLFLLRRFDHPLAFPGLLLGGAGLFYLLAWLGGATTSALGARGWLLGPFPAGDLWPRFYPSDLALIDWTVIIRQAPSLAPILLIAAVSVLLNTGGLEIATRRDIDVNRELRAAGLANLISSLAAGLVGYQQLSLSMLNFKGKSESRLVGLIASGLCIFALAAGASLLSLVPKMIVGALLLYLGLTFLVEWVVESWFTMSKVDYFIVIVILLVTATIGFLEAVALGLIVAMVLFVIGFSRIDVVRHELTEASYSSRTERSREQRQILEKAGDQVLILELQDFIFFGSAESIFERVRQRLNDPEQPLPRYVQLDFRRVTGIDSTATLSFARLQRLAEGKDFTLFYTGTSEQVRRQLEQVAGAGEGSQTVRFAESLEQGTAWCEDEILQQLGAADRIHPSSLPEQLAEILPDAEYLAEMLPYLEKLEVEAGYCFIRQGDSSDDLFFVQQGKVTTVLQQEDGESVRLGTIGGGVLGEIGFYLGQQRTASVVAESPTILYRLTQANLRRMERENPQAASNLHAIIVHLLSERVAHLVKTVQTLER